MAAKDKRKKAKVINIHTRKRVRVTLELTSQEKERIVILVMCGMSQKEALSLILDDRKAWTSKPSLVAKKQ